MPLEIITTYGKEDLATVFVAKTSRGKLIEFVESFQPPLPIEKKWVNIVSIMYGCPVRCLMCDAGNNFKGNLSKEEILAQIEYLVKRRFPNKKIISEKWKLQFTRMGEPAFNNAVHEVLETLPNEYNTYSLIPSVSTIAPFGKDRFFERLLEIKENYYSNGHFQLQFSIHTTDFEKRDELIPIKKWDFEKIAVYGEKFFKKGDRKITLNFALIEGYPVNPSIVKKYFNPDKFLIKITPLNPTKKTKDNKLFSVIDQEKYTFTKNLINLFKLYGYDVILSIGELEENQIGSNCGQFVSTLS